MNNAAEITDLITRGLARRHRAERRFQRMGLASIGFAALMLVTLLATIVGPGISGLMRHEVRLEIDTAPFTRILAEDPGKMDFYLHTQAILRGTVEPSPRSAAERHALTNLIGFFAAQDVKRQVMNHPEQWHDAVTVWVPLSSTADLLLKGTIDREADAGTRMLSDLQLQWLNQLEKDGRIRRNINWDFLTRGDSRAPESAGFLGSIVGSLLTLIVCMALAMPIAIMAAITLEEFAKKTRIAEWLEVVINNLAAVPSIIYGLLGLSVFLQVLHLPRSSALAGGLTLAMLILPVMIIAARSAIRAVPPSMRMAATGLGASPLQVVRHHVLPYALPGIMTGTILSICRALGETAPLLMIGMVAFVADIPRGATDPATAMPVEIYLWASSPELGFVEKTASGILVLLAILLLLNWVAIKVRSKSQLTWS